MIILIMTFAEMGQTSLNCILQKKAGCLVDTTGGKVHWFSIVHRDYYVDVDINEDKVIGTRNKNYQLLSSVICCRLE
jgi:hypothetical protein